MCFRPVLPYYTKSPGKQYSIYNQQSGRSLYVDLQRLLKLLSTLSLCCLPQMKIQCSKNNYSQVLQYIANAFFRPPGIFQHNELDRVGTKYIFLRVFSGFRREVAENCALLGYYTASSHNFLLTFQNNLSVPSSRLHISSITVVFLSRLLAYKCSVNNFVIFAPCILIYVKFTHQQMHFY